MHRPRICLFAILAAVGVGGPVATAKACCNALPVVARDYQSTLGSVRERIVAPGNSVTITRKPCDTLGGTTPPFFDPVATNNLVTIVFNPLDGSTGGTKTTAGLSSLRCDKSGNCNTCPASSPYPCNTLTFTMPDTDADLPPPDGDGWTGPATITVTTGGSTTAKIDYLYPPSDGCDCGGGAPSSQCQKEGDGVFMQFTVLPTANDFQSLVTGWPLRMTLDGGGNLLVPIHHPATAYSKAGYGQWERGEGTFCAKPSTSDPSCLSGPTMAKQLASAAPGSLQAFTISGQRVAPIFDHDDGGELFGVADVEYSVLWIRKGSGAGYDLQYRIKNGKGPIRVDKSGGSSGSQFDLTSCRLARLVSMRVATGALANVDDTNTVQIHERVQAGKDCGADTHMVADNVDLGVVTDVALEAQGSLVAFLKQGGPTVDAFSEKGKRLTPAQVQTATTAWRVNDHALAVEEPLLPGDDSTVSLVYFFDPNGELRTFNRKTKKFEDVAPANLAAALGQRVVTQPPTGMAQAHRYPWSTSTNHSTLSVSATELAIAPDLIAAAATGGTVEVWPWPATSPLPNTSPLDSGVATDQHLGIANACTGSGCTRLAVNSKTTAGDHVLRIFSFDPSTGSLQDTLLNVAADDFVIGDRLVAFRTHESAGNDLNNDGDTDDVVMRVVAFDAVPPYTPHVFETGWPAVGPQDPNGPWNVLGWRTAYQAVGDDLFFVTRECDQHGTVISKLCPSGGTDLNRDGDADDLVLQIYHQGSKTVNAVAAVGTGPVAILPLPNGVSLQVAGSAPPEYASADAAADAAPLCAAQAGAALVDVVPAAGVSAFPLPTPKGGIVVGDGDRDGVLDGFDNCETSPNAAQFDDDRDGLGDRFCDPTYCTNFTPPAIAPRGPLAPSAQRAAFRYFMQLGRPKASLSCLERIASGEISGDPETLCRGSFVADVANRPFDEQTAAFETRSELGFLTVLDRRGEKRMLTADQTQAFRQLVRSFGESVNAATRVAYGQVQKLPAGRERDFQINLGRESVRHLETLVAAMSDCLDRNAKWADAAARCLGRIEGGTLVFPADERMASRMRSVNDALRAATDDGCDGCILSKLDTCASDARRELDCPVCTNWRNAVEVVERVYGPAPAEPRLAHVARK